MLAVWLVACGVGISLAMTPNKHTAYTSLQEKEVDNCVDHWYPAVLTSPSFTNQKIFIAGLLHNNDPIMDTYSRELLRLVSSLNRDNVFVSLHESGSSDSTSAKVQQLADRLMAMQVPHVVTSWSNETMAAFSETHEVWQHTARIAFLAYLRNEVMEPLFTMPQHYDKVLFLNDVFFCAEDAAVLLSEPTPYHMVSGFDLIDRTPRDMLIYDSWVLRDITGDMLPVWGVGRNPPPKMTLNPPFFSDEYAREAVMSGRPFPVQCSWGGMAAIDARVFYEGNVRFRKNLPGECPMSECSLICNDIWRIYGSNTRILVDPRIATAYSPHPWNMIWNMRKVAQPKCSLYNSWHALLHMPYTLDDPSLAEMRSQSPPPVTVPETVRCAPLVQGFTAEFSQWHADRVWNLPMPTVSGDEDECHKVCVGANATDPTAVVADLGPDDFNFVSFVTKTASGTPSEVRLHFAVNLPPSVAVAEQWSIEMYRLFRNKDLRDSWDRMSMSIIVDRTSDTSDDMKESEQTGSIALNTAFTTVGMHSNSYFLEIPKTSDEILHRHIQSMKSFSRVLTSDNRDKRMLLVQMNPPSCSARDLWNLLRAARNNSNVYVDTCDGVVKVGVAPGVALTAVRDVFASDPVPDLSKPQEPGFIAYVWESFWKYTSQIRFWT